MFQECNLVNSLSVSENMFLNKLNGGRGLVNWKQINATTQEFLDSLCFDFRATAKIEALSASQKQMVEIAKVLYKKPRVIVMDEPTSSLTTGETRHLFEIMHTLKENGTTIVYISHKMDEIFEMCDTATVVRDGNVIETVRRRTLRAMRSSSGWSAEAWIRNIRSAAASRARSY